MGNQCVLKPIEYAAVEVLRRFRRIRNVILKIDSVGHMTVNVQIGKPRGEQPKHGPHLRCVGFHVIAVEIEILRIDAPSHLFRTVLVYAIVLPGALMSINTKDRHKQQDRVIKKRLILFGDRNLAHQHQACILSVDLTGVNSTLNKYDGVAAFLCFRRLEQSIL